MVGTKWNEGCWHLTPDLSTIQFLTPHERPCTRPRNAVSPPWRSLDHRLLCSRARSPGRNHVYRPCPRPAWFQDPFGPLHALVQRPWQTTWLLLTNLLEHQHLGHRCNPGCIGLRRALLMSLPGSMTITPDSLGRAGWAASGSLLTPIANPKG